MQYLLSSQEMKQCDKNTIEYFGVPSLVLMERAALSVYGEILQRFPKKEEKALVLCGAGNNGGDGFAIARLLHLAGYKIKILFPMEDGKLTPEAKAQRHSALQYGIPEIFDWNGSSYDVIIDALFGIGLSRNIEGKPADILRSVNQATAYKIAVDIASGIETDTGQILGTAFRADLTVAFGFAKIGQLLYPGAEYTGMLHVADIGIDANSLMGKRPAGSYLKAAGVKELLPVRSAYSNKGSYGKALVIAGSFTMAGAAYFAAKAAYYSGCGLVRIFTAKENREILLTKLPEAIITTYEAGQTNWEELDDCLEWADAVLAGPGISQSAAAEEILAHALKKKQKKIVLDADALNLLSKRRELLHELSGERVITPHLGEMSRLLGKTVKKIQSEILKTAVSFAEKYQICCVLKDARTVIGMPDGTFFVNTSGNHGMATGGSGDVLSGFLTGFLAQGLSLKDAAALSVYLHGTAGDFAREKRGAAGMLASDILEMLPETRKLSGKE